MSDKTKKLEGVKQEIRSVLLSQPKDMSIPALLTDYRSMVGQSLPFTEFGYSSPDEFLRSIPNVVTMNWSKKYNTYMLRAVADESTKHIEKLVSKQKTSKSAARASHRTSTAPPRFNKIQNKNAGRPYLSAQAKSEIYAVVKEYKNGLSLPNFLTVFRRKCGKELVYQNFGFHTLEDCLNSIPEVLLRRECNEMRVYPIIEKSDEESAHSVYQGSSNGIAHNDNKENKPTNVLMTENAFDATFSGNLARNKTMNSLDDFSGPDEHSGCFGIPPALKEQFKQIMKKNPQGIWVSQFPAAVQELTGGNLEHHKLGYFNLIDLFNDLPEIFRIEILNDCRDDWMLLDATSPAENHKPKEGSKPKAYSTKKSTDTNSVVRNIRLLLQANCEGISLQIFHVLYKANCREQLDLSDLGFDSLPMFLDSIAERVPLKIDYNRREPKVYYNYKKETPFESAPDHMSQCSEFSSDIPHDAVVGCTEYKVRDIPQDLNPDQFFPVYLSAVVDPSHIYIQLHGDTSVYLERLMDELQAFYSEKESECYRMPRHYIISGIVCAAVWPTDGRWHRIWISSVPSSDTVVAFFMDYGTKERIQSDNLRFLREKFMEMPAEAIRAHLCRLKPSHGDQWDPAAKDFILSSFEMQPLMACLTQTPVLEESQPLVLCDVSGDSDIFLNDILVSKGFAQYATDENVGSEEASGGQLSYIRRGEDVILPIGYQKPQLLSTTQQLPALPGGAPQNPAHVSVINTSSMKNRENIQNSSNLSRSFNSRKFDSLDISVVNNLQNGGTIGSMQKPSADYFVAQPTESIPGPKFGLVNVGLSQTVPYHVSHGSDSDVFESDEEIDDDDNPEVNSISKRYVKRLNLDDGYTHVHMVVLNDTPYMCSGDITYLLWNHDDPDLVRRKLKNREIFIPNTNVKEVGYEQLFYQLERFQVRGVKTEVTGNHYITLFPFKNVVDILNIFGHPSIAIRDIIDNELFCFNPLDSFWKTISEEEFEENLSTEASNEKEQKISLYELKASLQALKFRKQTLKKQLYSSARIPSLCHEIEEVEAHCVEIERRIKELQVKIVSYQREKMYD